MAERVLQVVKGNPLKKGIVMFIYSDEWDGEVETVIEQYEAEIVNGKLILLDQYDETEYYKITLEPKSN